jgi:hypothetical protein
VKTPATQSRVAAVVDSLFRRWPSLVGFSVQEAHTLFGESRAQQFERELVLTDVATSPWLAHTQELCGEIAVAMLDLIDDEPATRALVLGRTFARSVH